MTPADSSPVGGGSVRISRRSAGHDASAIANPSRSLRDASWTTAAGLRVSAGIGPPPGAQSLLPAWWGDKAWAERDVVVALALHPDYPREGNVALHTVRLCARKMAGHADFRTGRACRPTNVRLAAEMGYSVRQMQRARAVLERLKLIRLVVPGRSIMTRAERLRAWRNGSSHRRLAAEFALCSIRYPQEARAAVDRVTPPREAWDPPPSHQQRGSSGPNRPKDERLRRTQTRRTTTYPVSAAGLRTRKLAAGVQARLGWLRAVSPRRLTSLHRFAQQDWTPLDVHRGLDELLRARGWSVPDTIRQPAAYLACLLRGLDPADRPGAIEAAMLAAERARRADLDARAFGRLPECPHGEPGGDHPTPDGRILCPSCRKATR